MSKDFFIPVLTKRRWSGVHERIVINLKAMYQTNLNVNLKIFDACCKNLEIKHRHNFYFFLNQIEARMKNMFRKHLEMNESELFIKIRAE